MVTVTVAPTSEAEKVWFIYEPPPPPPPPFATTAVAKLAPPPPPPPAPYILMLTTLGVKLVGFVQVPVEVKI
jgi:hypothetical protein